jgi:hypothetical protein
MIAKTMAIEVNRRYLGLRMNFLARTQTNSISLTSDEPVVRGLKHLLSTASIIIDSALLNVTWRDVFRG